MSKKPKMIVCRNCNTPIEKNVKICPSCGVKNKKPLFKKWWFVVFVLILVIIGIASVDKNKTDTTETEIETESEVFSEEETKGVEAEQPGDGAELVDGMRPEFKEAMDSYEEFMNEYCDFMQKYSESDGTDVELLADYTSYMSKYAEVVNDFEAWGKGEMNTNETAYYIDVQTRINEKLLRVAE